VTKTVKVPHDEFDGGFIVGYQLVKGMMVVVPGPPRGIRAEPNTT
jgi:hypothetical protein